MCQMCIGWFYEFMVAVNIRVKCCGTVKEQRQIMLEGVMKNWRKKWLCSVSGFFLRSKYGSLC